MSSQQVPEHHRRVIRALQIRSARAGPVAPADRGDGSRRRPAQSANALVATPSRAGVRGCGPPWPPPASSGRSWSCWWWPYPWTGPGESRVVQAAELSLSPATEPTPRGRSSCGPRSSERSFAGVRFPAWSEEFRWRADGARSDELDGRETETVFYRHTHHRIGYTVISGSADRASRRRREPDRRRSSSYTASASGRQDVVTFERNGRTCVLSGDVHDPNTLVKLASWRGDGSVPFSDRNKRRARPSLRGETPDDEATMTTRQPVPRTQVLTAGEDGWDAAAPGPST